MRGGVIVLILGLLKGFVSDTTRISKGNADCSMVRPGRQTILLMFPAASVNPGGM